MLVVGSVGAFAPAGFAAHSRAAGGTSCPSGTAAVLSPTLNVVEGGTATATFGIAAACSNIRVTLASYQASAGNFVLPQTLIDSTSQTLSTGYAASATQTLTVNVSPCFYQVDLVIGSVIVNLTSSNLYDTRKILARNGGAACSTVVTTTPSPAVAIGGTIHDTAYLSGVFAPVSGDTITFKLYGPTDATCSRPAIWSDIVPVSVSGIYTSHDYTPSAAGTYHWVASYSGDIFNPAQTANCADEPVIVSPKTPTIAATAGGDVAAGASTTDTATPSGARAGATGSGAHESGTVATHDSTPAVCGVGRIVSGPPKLLEVTVSDADSGIQAITVLTKTNADVTWLPSSLADHATAVAVTGTKLDQARSSSAAIQVTNRAGLSTTCDLEIPATIPATKRPTISAASTGGFSLRKSAPSVLFGAPDGVTLTGRAPGGGGQIVTLVRKTCLSKSAVEVTHVKAGANGAFSFRLKPVVNGVYAATAANETTAHVSVAVRPAITLTRISAARYRVGVATTSGISLDGRKIQLQRRVGGRWTTTQTVTLHASSGADRLTSTSFGLFAAQLVGAKLRAVLQASGCYAGSTSPTIAG
jgi:hypothetical protein